MTAAWIGFVCLPTLGVALQELVASGFRDTGLGPASASPELSPAIIRVAQEVLRIAAACWAAALLADLAQVGFVWSPVTLLPHEERVSPASGIARMLSWPTFERASLLSIKVLIAVLLIALIGEFALRSSFAGSGVQLAVNIVGLLVATTATLAFQRRMYVRRIARHREAMGG